VAGTAWQLLDYGWHLNPPFTSKSDAGLFFPSTPAVAAIERDATRRGPTSPQRLIGLNGFLGNESAVFSLEAADGYDSAVSSRVRSLWYIIDGLTVNEALTGESQITALGLSSGSSSSYITHFLPTTTRLSLLPRVGVTTIMADPPEVGALAASAQGASPVQLQPVYFGTDADVFDLPGDQPRAWVVHQADIVPDGATALRRFASESFDYRDQMLVEPDQGLGSSGAVARRGSGRSDAASRDGLTLNGTSFTVRTDHPGWLVMADAYAPGWRATVNGHATTVLRADYTLRAVAIPAGRSRVALSYRPPGLTLGIVTSMLAALALVVIAVWSLRRRLARPVAAESRPRPPALDDSRATQTGGSSANQAAHLGAGPFSRSHV
jgi:hypothetical protein